MRRVGIIGIGATKARPATPTVSYKELTYEAAKLAYQNAQIRAQDVQSFVTLAEDFNEGTSIFDEYTPDQLGGARKPNHTLTHDGLVGIADAYMQIASGLFDIVVVEAHSKASNIGNLRNIQAYALDPNWVRPLGIPAEAIGALEATAYWQSLSVSAKEAADAQWTVVYKNKGNARKNPHAAWPAALKRQQYDRSAQECSPLKTIEVAPMADGACVIVLAAEDKIKINGAKPVWLQGVGWASETSEVGSRQWAKSSYATDAAARAYKMAGITRPADEIDLFEIDDTFAFKELQHLESIGVFETGSAWKRTLEGRTAANGKTPVNVSGGCLGFGDLLEAKGLFQVYELVKQLKGQAGARQVSGAHRACALSWRGVPTTSGACAILGIN